MLTIKPNHYLLSILVFALTLTSGNAYSDDTEIYFSTGSSSGNTSNAVLPNVLFILDTSGSMDSEASGTGKSRIAVLKEAMNLILADVNDINLGLMRFTYTNGGPVLYPITGIDEYNNTVVSEEDDSVAVNTYTLSDDDEDGQEDSATDVVTLNAANLTIGEVPSTTGTTSFSVRVNTSTDAVHEQNGSVRNNEELELGGYSLATDKLGVRFTGITIPQGANILSANINLTTESEEGGNADFKIKGHDVDNSSTFTLFTNDVTTRLLAAPTTATTVINNHRDNNNDEDIDDPDNDFDVTAIVQEIINRAGWTNGNAMSFIFYDNDRRRDFHSYVSTSNNSKRPILEIDYTTTAGPAQPSEVALHFPEVNVPKDATITDARLVFRSSATVSGTASWNIDVENVDDSAALTNAANDIGSRTLTGAPVNVTSNTGTVSERIPDPFTVDDSYSTPDLTSIVQTVVNRSGWCGGNAMTFVISGSGTRYVYSYDANSSDAPQLEITYDRTGTLGCAIGDDSAQISSGTDDVENSNTGGSQLDFESGNNIGLRFRNMDIPQGATITNAFIRIRAREDDSGSSTITIYGEDADDATTYGNVNSRTKTTASVAWSPTTWNDNTYYDSDNISTIVQEIVDRGGWTSGNAMAFIMETTGNNRRGRSYNDSTTHAPRLYVSYQSTSSTTSPLKTVRERLIELVNDLPTSDWTPITEVLYEATHYWRGESVTYGKSREGLNDTRLSHPGSYCNDANDCNGANTASYPPYGIDEPSGCSTSNLDDSDCRNRAIKGSPDYISPFSSELSCAQNYQVLLTDGEANSSNLESTIESEYSSDDFGYDTDDDGDGDGQCRTQKSDGSSISTSEKCAIDLAEFLFRDDQSSTLDNDQTVITHTVGFDTANLPNATQFLEDIADAGGGDFYEGISATDLVTVFESILADVKDQPTSFVAPSLATNAFNRLLSRDEVYFGLFTPELNASWDGNVKKYKVCIESDPDGDGTEDCSLGEILDQTGGAAIDDTTDRFKTGAQSYWSDSVDGLTTTAGGTGDEFDDYTDRIIYTETTSGGTAPTSGTLLSGSGYKITSSNWDDSNLATVRTAVCPTPSTTAGSECEDRMLWMLGKVLQTSDTDVDGDTRWTVNDVLHSSPGIITYGGEDTDTDNVIDTFFDKLVYGSNDGALHFVNAADNSGKEEWIFMPQSLINNQQAVYTDAEGDHLYGMDLTPVLNQYDADGDGSIETGDGDFVHIISGMRRGGMNYYALDVSANVSSTGQTIVPKFLWRIDGGASGTDYERLGQTWSRPVLGDILVSGGSTQEVMVFGGGYDTALDSDFGTDATSGSDNDGNMIFITDPSDGSLIFSIGGTGSGADIVVADMHYSIPSRVTLLDSDGDGFEDRIYVADTGGQVWRVDLASDINPAGASPEGSSVVGRLAAISTQGTEADERRFFEPPSIVQVKDTLYADAANSEYDYVLIGSGNRANPLNEVTQDRFYAFRDYTTGPMTGGTGGSANLAQDYPRSGGSPISHATATDLVDVTSSVLDENSSTVDASFGWYFDFYSFNSNSAGEKVLSAPLTIAGTVLFTTYAPDQNNSVEACEANVGGGNAYNFDILSTKATLDWDADGNVENVADRKQTLGGGIPSDVVPIFTKEGIVGIVGVEGGASQLGTLAGLPRYRTYWYEEG